MPISSLFAPSGSAKLFIDTTWAGLGGTQISAQLYNGSFTWSDFIRAERYHDGRVDLDFTQHEYSAGRKADLELDIVAQVDGAGAIDVERAAKTARSLRFVRLEFTGPVFASPDDSLNHFVRFDGAYYHAEDSLVERGGERNGSNMGHMHLESAYDSTQAQDVEFSVQTLASSFP